MVPEKLQATDGSLWFPRHPKWAELTVEQILELVCIPGSTAQDAHAPVWNGHEFEAMAAIVERGPKLSFHESIWEGGMTVYLPIDPRMTEADVAGATVAYPNEDNDGWLFAHCDNDYMRDRESHPVATLTDAFAPMHRQLSRKLQRLELDNIVERLKEPAFEKIELMEAFHVDAEMNLRAWARDLHIGHYHQNPHDAHVNEPIEAAISKTGTAWVADKAAKFQKISAEVVLVLARASSRHDYETRWDKIVRKAEEKRVLAAKGTDPVDGYEYCYTAIVSPHVISGATNLPSNDWAFDHLRNGQVIRGDYTYTDGEPTRNAFLFIAIRFRRPVPEGTQPGAFLGDVQWEQEPAYFIKTTASS